MPHEEILSFLLTLPAPNFFTRDLGLGERSLCHARRCLVTLAVGQYETAHFVRRFLRHRGFNTHARRLGAVVRVMPTGLVVWRLRAQHELRLSWSD